MDSALISFALAVGTALGVAAALFKVWPAIARAQFRARVSELHDIVDDAVIRGELPEGPAVGAYLRRAEHLLDQADEISLGSALAMHAAMRDLGVQLSPGPIHSYASLTPEQRKMMFALDGQMAEAVTDRLVDGSTFALPLRLAIWLHRKTRGRTPAIGATPRPSQLANEYVKLSESPRFRTAASSRA